MPDQHASHSAPTEISFAAHPTSRKALNIASELTGLSRTDVLNQAVQTFAAICLSGLHGGQHEIDAATVDGRLVKVYAVTEEVDPR